MLRPRGLHCYERLCQRRYELVCACLYPFVPPLIHIPRAGERLLGQGASERQRVPLHRASWKSCERHDVMVPARRPFRIHIYVWTGASDALLGQKHFYIPAWRAPRCCHLRRCHYEIKHALTYSPDSLFTRLMGRQSLLRLHESYDSVRMPSSEAKTRQTRPPSR